MESIHREFPLSEVNNQGVSVEILWSKQSGGISRNTLV